MSEPRKLNPRKLTPPQDVIRIKKEKNKEKLFKNPILRFFYIFFGEGF